MTTEPKTVTIKTGGPAFPEGESWESSDLAGMRHYNSRGPLRPGMNMRQWYAGQALQGMLACSDTPASWTEAEMAEAAFRYADAMVAKQWRETAEPEPGGAA